MSDGKELVKRPELCDEQCTHWRRCRKPRNCPVLQKTKAAMKRNGALFPSEEELERAVDDELKNGAGGVL